MIFEYNKLKGKIREVAGTQENFANMIGISTVSLSLRLNNKAFWSQDEINKSCEVLAIPDTEVSAYFFNQKV